MKKRIKKSVKKRFILTLLLLVAICVELISFNLSKAQKYEDIKFTITDYDNKLPEQSATLTAVNSEKNGFYVDLPKTINGKYVDRYYAEIEEIQETKAIGKLEFTQFAISGDNAKEFSANDLVAENKAGENKVTNENLNKETQVENNENLELNAGDKGEIKPSVETKPEANAKPEINAKPEANAKPEDKVEKEPKPQEKPQDKPNELDNSKSPTETVKPNGEEKPDANANPDETAKPQENVTPDKKSEETNTQVPEKNTNTNEIKKPEIKKVKKIVELNPGDLLYLTDEQLANKAVKISVKYVTKTVNDVLLYKQDLEANLDSNKISVQGYIPIEYTLKVEYVSDKKIIENVGNSIDENNLLMNMFTIKIIKNDLKFVPKDYGETINVTVTGMNKENEYKVLEIDEQKVKNKNIEKISKKLKAAPMMLSASPKPLVNEKQANANGITEVKNTTQDGANLNFTTDNPDTYAILKSNPQPPVDALTIDKVDTGGMPWDGTIATNFKYGNGTKANPYLIVDGKDLAYLAQQVNAGTSFSGKYFQITNDIDLANKEWTPIGNRTNPFDGIIDGSGHSISNARIITKSNVITPDAPELTYGLFGAIKGGNSRVIVQNIELANFIIIVNAVGPDVSVAVGTLVGTLYSGADVQNIIINNSEIRAGKSQIIKNNEIALLIGGVVGELENDANQGIKPSKIENCYASSTIDISAFESSDSDAIFPYPEPRNVSQISTGGIVGRIKKQNYWPNNCLVKTNIKTNGFAGPIFGTVLKNSEYRDEGQFNNLWNGNNNAQNKNKYLKSNSYFSDFQINGKTFTNGFEKGVVPNDQKYRISASYNDGSWPFDSRKIGYVQGVNKGKYLTDESTMNNLFNSYKTKNNVEFLYSGGTFKFKKRLNASVTEIKDFTYQINVDDPYNVGNYKYDWFVNGVLDTNKQNTTVQNIEFQSFDQDLPIEVIVNDGEYFSVVRFVVPKLYVDIELRVDTSDPNNIKVIGKYVGSAIGTKYFKEEDFTIEWFENDLAGLNPKKVEGANSLIVEHAKFSNEYKIVAINSRFSQFDVEKTIIVGNRKVVYLDHNNGSDSRLGETPETAVRSLERAYELLDSSYRREENIIVLMSQYLENYIFDSETATVYRKNCTITGAYNGKKYNPTLRMGGSSYSYLYLQGDTTFQYMKWDGNYDQLYFFLQGNSLTMGEQVTMVNYAQSNTNQGLISERAPAVHIFGGWLRYDESRLPKNNAEILIKSGTYGRIILGGSPGTTGAANLMQYTSRNFIGSDINNDPYISKVIIDIQNPTTNYDKYDCDVNLLVGGSACGNIIGHITEDVKAGKIGRILGGSIGDSSDYPRNWNEPINTFIGSTTINISGGEVRELYGGCLGRNMRALDSWRPNRERKCDSYFYGDININITGGNVIKDIYGAGAGGVTGYHPNTTDPFGARYGQNVPTNVNINITGGTVDSNIYGGGYGYTNYLVPEVITRDGGNLYGNSNIVIGGSAVINGNVFGAGRGYDISNLPKLAQMYGTSTITINDSPTITREIYGGGFGNQKSKECAKLIGNSKIQINSNLSSYVYGGGNIAEAEGTTLININSGKHTGEIYGGGNIGNVNGSSTVNIKGGENIGNIYGGGNQALITSSVVNINGGNNKNNIFGGGNRAASNNSQVNINGGNNNFVFAGGNQAELKAGSLIVNGGITSHAYGGSNSANAPTTNVTVKNGTVQNLFGGSNLVGNVTKSNVLIESGTVDNIFGGNNKGGLVTETSVNIKNGKMINVFGGGNNAPVTTSNVLVENGTIQGVFGGGNQAGVQTATVDARGGNITNIYGGSNQSGDVPNTNVLINGTDALHVQNVYGGNNKGGFVQNPIVKVAGGNVQNVYGGGNQAQVNVTNTTIQGGNIGNVFGGGNEALVRTNTNLNVLGGNISINVYGGGNEGIVKGNSNAIIQDAKIIGSVYGGGNGRTAVVNGNSSLTIKGNTEVGFENCDIPRQGCVFGGGNAAATGQENASQKSLAKLDILGGTIWGNAYGGANTSVVYGKTDVNIGKEATADTISTAGNIYIKGTVFGGGEANAEGSEIYDYDFISVTDGIDVDINGTSHPSFKIEGSIFGSGNASRTTGTSNVYIKKFGTVDDPQSNISIQRANTVVLDDSAIALSGAKDRTNEYSNEFFTLSRIDTLKLKNSSTLYLNYGANLLKNFYSTVDINGTEQMATAVIDEKTGDTTTNVENRMYMFEGKNLNIALDENVTTFGKVFGMTYLGLFTNSLSPAKSTGLYHHSYKNGNQIVNAGTFMSNSYVLGQHKPNHDSHVDGFYTTINNEGIAKTEYVKVTPEQGEYYMWAVGEAVDTTVYEMTLTASKYVTLGTSELKLTGFSTPNTKFVIYGFSAGLNEGIELVKPSEILPINPDQDKADSQFGLNMRNGKNGWVTNNENIFYTADGGRYDGSSDYITENSNVTPTLSFCLYHSQNISKDRLLGNVRIRFQVLIPVDDLNYEIQYADIIINLLSDLYQYDFYESAITPGEEFELFTSTETNITDDGDFSTFYSLYIPEFHKNKLFKNYKNHDRCLLSRNVDGTSYPLHENTRIVMMDLVTNKIYYYIVTKQDEQSGKYRYLLTDFIKMGSENEKYKPNVFYNIYYNQGLDTLHEKYIFHVSLEGTNITQKEEDNTLFMELQDKNGSTLLGVLGMQRDTTTYSVYPNNKATIKAEVVGVPNTVYVGEKFRMDVKTNFKQPVFDSKIIFDTKYFKQKVGLKITLLNQDGQQLNLDSLMGTFFELDGERYYPRIDGTTRIKVADRLSNVLSRITVDTSQNSTLATGQYTMKIETFASSDGIYYGLEASDFVEKSIYIINGAYGLKVTSPNDSKVIDKVTGKTINDTNRIDFNLEYTSVLTNPKITVSLERRNYDEIYSLNYDKVDLKEYVSNTLTEFNNTKEYIVTTTPAKQSLNSLNFKENLKTGTYKVVYKLYDNNTFIGDACEYVIIR